MSFPRSGSLDRMEWKRTCTLITTVWDQLGSPLGRRGMRVLKVPQLSDQPCRHSTGRPSSGPQTLPLSCPQGTGMDSSESGHETFCLLCTQTGAAAPLHVAMGPKRTRRGVFCRFSKPEHCAGGESCGVLLTWSVAASTSRRPGLLDRQNNRSADAEQWTLYRPQSAARAHRRETM